MTVRLLARHHPRHTADRLFHTYPIHSCDIFICNLQHSSFISHIFYLFSSFPSSAPHVIIAPSLPLPLPPPSVSCTHHFVLLGIRRAGVGSDEVADDISVPVLGHHRAHQRACRTVRSQVRSGQDGAGQVKTLYHCHSHQQHYRLEQKIISPPKSATLQ